ncbi:MAG: hypothetical protein ACP5NI_09705, partial [Acetobacteraceae bacterium]
MSAAPLPDHRAETTTAPTSAPVKFPAPPTISITQMRKVSTGRKSSGATKPMNCARIAPASPISAAP